MFGKKQTGSPRPVKKYDAENSEPVIRCSICTGERTAGFRDLRSGKFTDVMLIKNDADLRSFMEEYGLESIKKIY